MTYKVGKAVFYIFLSLLIFYGSIKAVLAIDGQAKNDNQTDVLIGMSHSDLSDPWQISLYEQMNEEIEKNKDARIIFRNAAQSTYKQIKDIYNLIDFGVDVLIITVNDENVLNPIIRKVQKEIPVIVLDRPLNSYDYQLFIGPDNYEIGQKAGKKVLEVLGEEGGTVLEILGSLESSTTVARSQGFRETLKGQRNIQIVASFSADWQRDQAEDLFQKYLDRMQNVDVVFAHNDAMALGAYRAAMKKGLNDLYFIGVGEMSNNQNNGLRLVQNKTIDTLFMYPLGGKEAIEYAIQIHQGKNKLPKKIILKSYEVTLNNIDDFLSDKRNTGNIEEREQMVSKIKLGFVRDGLQDSWSDSVLSSIQRATDEEDIELIVKDIENGLDLQQMQRLQKDQVRELIDEAVDIILLSPIVAADWEETLREAKRAGIPVILLNGEVKGNDDLWASYIGGDYYDQGKMAARWIIENLYDGKENINILEIIGTPESMQTLGRIQGFSDMIKGYSNITIEEWEVGYSTFEGGKAAIENLLKSGIGNINVIFAHNDAMALGAIQALKEAGIRPGEDIKVISINGTREGMNALRAGKINFIVQSDPLEGDLVVELVNDLIHTTELPKKLILEDRPVY